MANLVPPLRCNPHARGHRRVAASVTEGIDMQRFNDRRIIVTGAGSGIGQATTARLLDEGGTVRACDVNAEGLAATTAAAEHARTAKRLTSAVLDISSEAAVADIVDAAIADMGGLDVLVNAAGIQD